jgi:DNA-binding CsgD family transcriptional regulator
VSATAPRSEASDGYLSIKQHLAPSSPATDQYDPREQRYNVVAARIPPVLVVVTVDMQVLGWSPHSEAAKLIVDAGDDLRDVVRTCCARGQQTVHIIDEDVILRIAPLESHGAECAVIMIESFGHRGSLAKAAKAYRLTKRELEILGFVIQGMSNAEIADRLFIAHSTVADHLKSLLRKTQSTKRIHLLSKLGYGEPD